MNVAILGHGFCGKATERMLRTSDSINRIQIQDPKYKQKISPDEWDLIDYAFVCVPTPLVQNYSVMDHFCLLYTSPSPRDKRQSRMPSSA